MDKSEKFLQQSILSYVAGLQGVNASKAVEELKDVFGISKMTQNTGTPKLEAVFKAGLDQLFPEGFVPITEGAAEKKTMYDIPADLRSSAKFKQFLDSVTSKGYFGDHKEGSEEYGNRLEKVVDKFKARMGAKSAASEDGGFEEAEKLKSLGNDALMQKNYEEAADFYSQAIEKNPSGKNAHIYYCNRAAAFQYMDKFDEAIADCSLALALDSSYVKAHTRMAQCYLNSGRNEEAKEAAKIALDIDPSNASAIQIMAQVEDDITPKENERGAGSGGFKMPDLGGMDFGAMMNNPMIQQMAQQFASNPDMMNSMASMMGGLGGSGGMPNISELMNNPGLRQMAEQMSQDPSMMENLGNLMGKKKDEKK